MDGYIIYVDRCKDSQMDRKADKCIERQIDEIKEKVIQID